MASNGGPAFPFPHTSNLQPGMSLRDYFAGQAMIGLMTNHEALKKGTDWVVAHAFIAADAMLAARKET